MSLYKRLLRLERVMNVIQPGVKNYEERKTLAKS